MNVPSLRACPKCKQTIELIDGCKHTICPSCKTDFCFVCLLQVDKFGWKSG